MKTFLAYALGVTTVCAAFAMAGPAQAGDGTCHLDGAGTDLSAKCKAERSALREKTTDCMTRRANEAKAAGAAAVSAHATRARYLLCAAEVSGNSGPVFP